MALTHINEDLNQFKDEKSEARLVIIRIISAFFMVFILFSILIFHYYNLQIVHHQDYATEADNNRIQVQPVPPTRGLIFDRTGEILADNRASFTLSVTSELVSDLDATLAFINSIVPLSQDDIANFHRALKQPRRPHQSVPLKFNLSEEEIAAIAVNEYRLDGIEVEARLVRYYPYGELFSHSIGYVGRISENDLNEFDEEQYKLYSGSHAIGKSGLEKFYEKELFGQVGTQNVEVNAHGRFIRIVSRVDPTQGKDLHLFLDIRLQKVAAEAMAGKRGAVVAIDVATGGVLAFVSTPSYDPNLFVTGISFQKYKELNESIDVPLFNRAIQAQYPPGSTLKPMLGLGGLESGIITSATRIRDPGYFQLPGKSHKYRDWKKWGHGSQVDLYQAIVESCDTYFFSLSARMGVDRMNSIGTAFGLGNRTGIDIPNERAAVWPSRPWKKATKGMTWFPGDSLNMSIGQGFVLATPVQLAVMAMGLANRGKVYKPRLVEKLGDQVLESSLLSQYIASNDNWDRIGLAMESVVHSPRGTAKVISQNAPMRMAGKTGTAQVISIAQEAKYDRNKIHERKRDHALFISYAPADNPQIAVAVIVENGEHGSSGAAPIARAVYDAWYEIEQSKMGKPSVNQDFMEDLHGF